MQQLQNRQGGGKGGSEGSEGGGDREKEETAKAAMEYALFLSLRSRCSFRS